MRPHLKWMPIDVGHYISSTMNMGATESGAYSLLMFAYWEMGKLPDDDKALARLTRLSLRQWKKIKETVAYNFEMPGWRNPYLDGLRAKAELKYTRRLQYLKAQDEKRPAPADWAIIRTRVFARDDYTCTYCGRRGGDLHCDHVIPIARGGINSDDNLTTSCVDCNLSKGALLLSEWRK